METVTIQTTYGAVKGVQLDGYQAFKGIRYATADRFQKPVPYLSEVPVYDATAYGYTCPQPGQPAGSFYDREFWHHKEYATEKREDCLYLNIWRPDHGENLPVAIWIHGGAFLNGFGSKVEIDGEYLNKQGVILVSINYRVGILGFLCHQMLEEAYGYCGNYGIYDQLCAINWVREHIASFGGDPNHITVMGQSAGAMSVLTLISSPLLPEGVTGAVMQSGGGIENFLNASKTLASQKELHGELLEEMGIDTLDKLLQADADRLVADSCVFTERRKIPNLLFAPTIHTDLLPDTYEALVRGGHVRDIPCLIGCTRNDITVGDDLYSSPIYTGCVKWALATEQAGHTPSYVYVFDRAPLGGEGQGAFHSCDLWYSFHTLGRSWREKEPVDYRIADEMNRRWADFIRTGSPNDETLPPWSPFTAANPEVKHFG